MGTVIVSPLQKRKLRLREFMEIVLPDSRGRIKNIEPPDAEIPALNRLA